jgi:MCP family monocarboxylic acid transporter-like MFS transporter 10
MGEVEDVGRRSGMMMTIIAMGALAGPPISGAINNATGGFREVGYFAGWGFIKSFIKSAY